EEIHSAQSGYARQLRARRPRARRRALAAGRHTSAWPLAARRVPPVRSAPSHARELAQRFVPIEPVRFTATDTIGTPLNLRQKSRISVAEDASGTQTREQLGGQSRPIWLGQLQRFCKDVARLGEGRRHVLILLRSVIQRKRLVDPRSPVQVEAAGAAII